ncbi:MAG: hypothetical protein J0I20_10650 [Chloroflexi bacterium]|nr:hypothetical protein [Chloroflexota bacterium]OJV94459.1 MAG: hypothetical protein BGO39_22150 [Chloroflexi bacterium 54-19]
MLHKAIFEIIGSERNRLDFSILASGQVIYSAPGRTAFPVRLAVDIFQKVVHYRTKKGGSTSFTLYDPCCGSGYLLVTLAFLNWKYITKIIGSDIDPNALQIAQHNFSLLTPDGINLRIEQLSQLVSSYGKSSHSETLENARLFSEKVNNFQGEHNFDGYLFQADATKSEDLIKNLEGQKVNLVITDIPYGNRTSWMGETPENLPSIELMLSSLLPILSKDGIVALVSPKRQSFNYSGYKRLTKYLIGKRQVTILEVS